VNADDFEVVRVAQVLNGGFETDALFVWPGTGIMARHGRRSI
jgi:hypothetical protein